jgi:hypothetical protein
VQRKQLPEGLFVPRACLRQQLRLTHVTGY